MSRAIFIFFKDFCYCCVFNEFAKQKFRQKIATVPLHLSLPQSAACHPPRNPLLRWDDSAEVAIQEKISKAFQAPCSHEIAVSERPPENFAVLGSRPPMRSFIAS